MENFIIVAILLALVGGSGFYIWRAKKRGAGCIGCPCSGSCGGRCGSRES